MAYTIIKTDGTVLTSISDGTVNNDYSTLTLPGRNYAGYGQAVDTNFIHQLENYSYNIPPVSPLRGQLWYNTNNDTLNVCPADGIVNASEWSVITSTASGGPTIFGNITVTGAANVDSLSVTKGVVADTIVVRLATVTSAAAIVLANIATANITSLATTVISTGGAGIAGALTGNWTLTGNAVISGKVVPNAIWTDNYLAANGAVFQPLVANFANFAGNVTLSSQPNITTVGTLGSLSIATTVTAGGMATVGGVTTAGNVIALGNVSGANFTIAGYADIASYANIGGNANIDGNVIIGGKTDLNAIGNITITGGTVGQYLRTDGLGTLTWDTVKLSNIANGTSNVTMPFANGSIIMNVDGVTELQVVAGAVDITGDSTVGGQLYINAPQNIASAALLSWDSANGGRVTYAEPVYIPGGGTGTLALYWNPVTKQITYG